VSDFGRLRSYDRLLIPVHALVWTVFTEPAGGIMNSASLVASSRYLDSWEDIQEGGELVCRSGRAVHNWAAACVAAGSGIFENQL